MFTGSYLAAYYIKWGFESRLKPKGYTVNGAINYIKWGFESRLKRLIYLYFLLFIISNGDLRVD